MKKSTLYEIFKFMNLEVEQNVRTKVNNLQFINQCMKLKIPFNI
jgi:hypothetical protein